VVFVIVLAVYHRKSAVITNVIAVIIVAITELFTANVTYVILVEILGTVGNNALTVVTQMVSVVVKAFARRFVIARAKNNQC
jgi:hypothetical protein